jgi:hypothetical protein
MLRRGAFLLPAAARAAAQRAPVAATQRLFTGSAASGSDERRSEPAGTRGARPQLGPRCTLLPRLGACGARRCALERQP